MFIILILYYTSHVEVSEHINIVIPRDTVSDVRFLMLLHASAYGEYIMPLGSLFWICILQTSDISTVCSVHGR
jgi:hypothetical protein